MYRALELAGQRFLPLFTLVLILLLGGACTAANPAPGAQEAPAEWETVEDLVAAAEAEGGELMVYSSMNIDSLETILAEFQSAYPFVRPEYYRASGDNVIQKALTESQAGQQFADVYETQAFEIYRLLQVGLLEPFVAPESEAYPAGAKDPDGYWTVDRINLVVIGYNTELVDPQDVPGRWEDLVDPKWGEQMGVEASDVELLAMMMHHWGEEEAIDLWEGIAALQPGIVDGHTALAELVSAGEFNISPNLYAHRVENLKAKGAPLEWVRTDPVFVYAQMAAVAKDAPNPATARLFVNWLLSEEGQSAIQNVGRTPSRPGVGGGQDDLLADLNVVYTVPELAEDYNTYADIWNSTLGLE